jgi:hypothetical protein
MSLNHQQLLEQQQTATAKAEFKAAVAQGLLNIYRSHPEIRPCQANDATIKKHFGVDDVAFETEVMTPEAFDHDYENPNSGLRNQLAFWNEQQRRDQIEKQIMALLPVMSPDAKQNLHAQYAAKMPQTTLSVFDETAGKYLISTQSMEAKLERLRVGKDHEGMSTEELTAEVAQQRTIVGGFAPLPSNVTKWQVRLWDVKTLKHMIARHGLVQINAVLAKAD